MGRGLLRVCLFPVCSPLSPLFWYCYMSPLKVSAFVSFFLLLGLLSCVCLMESGQPERKQCLEGTPWT